MAQQGKDPVLSLQQHRFNPRPENFHMLLMWLKKSLPEYINEKVEKSTKAVVNIMIVINIYFMLMMHWVKLKTK